MHQQDKRLFITNFLQIILINESGYSDDEPPPPFPGGHSVPSHLS